MGPSQAAVGGCGRDVTHPRAPAPVSEKARERPGAAPLSPGAAPGHLRLCRKKARERRQPAREGNQGIGRDGLHDEDEGQPIDLLRREDRAPGIEPDGVVDER